MEMDKETTGKRSTISDVAREAKVSIKTVSRVVRQEPNVREKTREKVRAVMEKLNYRPTISARSTVSSRSFLIGLAFDNPNPTYTFDLLRGAQFSARRHGYHLVVEPLDRANGAAGKIISELVIQSNLDGLIVTPPLSDNLSVIEALEKIGKPYARIAPSIKPGLGFTVLIDDHAAAEAMTNHLLQLGHRKIGFVKGRKGTATTAKRLQGFKDAMTIAGANIEDWQICDGNFSLRSGMEAGLAMLEREDRPTAIFASNDDMAAGVVMAAHKLNLDIPGDVSVAGFDDSATARLMWPPLTTIRQPVSEMAEIAAQRIIEYQRDTDKKAIGNEELSFELIARESTGPVPETE